MVSYQNGVLIIEEKKPQVLSGHINTAHVFELNQQAGDAKPTSLGVLTPFEGYMAKKDIWLETLKPEQTIYIDDVDGKGTYTFSVPIPAKGTWIVKDISNVDRPGIDGTTFDLLFNQKFVGRGSTIKFFDTSDIDLYVKDYNKEGEYWRYTFVIAGANAKNKSVPKEWLKPGSQVKILSSVGSEYTTVYNDLNSVDTGGIHTFKNIVGNATAHVHYSVTRDAAYMQTSAKTLADYQDILYCFEFKPGSIGDKASRMNGAYSLPIHAYMKSMKASTDNDAVKNAMKRDVLRVSALPKIEYAAYMQIMADVNSQKIFGAGGQIQLESGQTAHLPVGIIQQMLRLNTSSYNIGDPILPMIENEIVNNLPSTIEPYSSGNKKIIVETGFGGYERACAEIKAKAGAVNYQMKEDDYVTGSGTNKGLKATMFNEYETEFGWILFKLNRGLDPVNLHNSIENPRIVVGGNNSRHLSSYVYMIKDLKGEGTNVIELRKKNYWDFSHMVTQGKLQYPIGGGVAGVNNGNAFITSDPRRNHGFEVFMEKPHEALLLKDPKSTLMIRPINPATQRPYASQYYNY